MTQDEAVAEHKTGLEVSRKVEEVPWYEAIVKAISGVCDVSKTEVTTDHDVAAPLSTKSWDNLFKVGNETKSEAEAPKGTTDPPPQTEAVAEAEKNPETAEDSNPDSNEKPALEAHTATEAVDEQELTEDALAAIEQEKEVVKKAGCCGMSSRKQPPSKAPQNDPASIGEAAVESVTAKVVTEEEELKQDAKAAAEQEKEVVKKAGCCSLFAKRQPKKAAELEAATTAHEAV